MTNEKETVAVTSGYQSAYPDPLRLRLDEKITVEQKECNWPGWLWCTDSNGKSGWIPEVFVAINGNEGTVVEEYDATELSVKKGDRLNVIREVAGWLICSTSDGRTGWVPIENTDWTSEK